MKKLFWSVLLLGSLGTAMTACNNGNYNSDPSSGYNNNPNALNSVTPTMYCGLGHYWWFSTHTVTVVDTNGVIGIMGSSQYPDTMNTKVVLLIHGYKGTGQYQLFTGDTASRSIAYVSGKFDTAGLVETGGAIYISNAGSRLQGTFLFSTFDTSFSITNGYFDVPNPLVK